VNSCKCLELALLESAEEISTTLAARIETAVDTHSVQLLKASTVELQDLVAWCDVPDVDEGNLSKLAAPLGSNADTTAQGGDHVAQALPAVEAFVGAGPHAVHGVDPLGFGEDVLESDLKVVIDVVGVTVDKINLGHLDRKIGR